MTGRPFVAELRQKTETAGADIGSRRVEQRAVIGERNMVEEVMGVVGVEGCPSRHSALHSNDPLRGTVERVAVALGVETIERQPRRGSVVEVGVVRVLVLEGPAAWP